MRVVGVRKLVITLWLTALAMGVPWLSGMPLTAEQANVLIAIGITVLGANVMEYVSEAVKVRTARGRRSLGDAAGGEDEETKRAGSGKKG